MKDETAVLSSFILHAAGTVVASALGDVERYQGLAPAGAVAPISTIALFGFNFTPG
jgi:hypothetical protein